MLGREDIHLRLTIDDNGVIELSIINNTIKGSLANKILYPLATGISIILEEDPNLLYEAGTELYDGDVYVDMINKTHH